MKRLMQRFATWFFRLAFNLKGSVDKLNKDKY